MNNLEFGVGPIPNPDEVENPDGNPGGSPGGFMPFEAMAIMGVLDGVKTGGKDKKGKVRGGGKK